MMNYIVFDLEFNQDYNLTQEERNTLALKCPFEVIQIGAVKLDENLNTLGEFNRLVRPVIYTNLNPYVKKMTDITMRALNNADTFDIVYKDFVDFIGSDNSIFCVWGAADMKELFRNIQYHKLDWSLIPKDYLDIQKHASRGFNTTKGTNIGLSNAVELLNIPLKDKFHDAFSDAYYTAEVFKNIDRDGLRINIYDPHSIINRPKAVKQQVNFNKMYKQFEKMYKREMSSEEKSIIRLAYMMGKTNQFSK